MIDQHFTPPLLASLLVDSLPNAFKPSYIADFAVGEGSLIYAALKKWTRGVNVVANDLSIDTLNLLTNNDWHKFNIDFLDTQAIVDSGLKKFENKIDLILLNPPFSQRSIKPILWEGTENKIKSGLALNFIYNSLNFLKSGGFLVAVVPNGCLTSQRDEKALNYLKENYKFQIIAHNREATFEKVRVKTSIIMIENIKPVNTEKNIISSDILLSGRVFRGKFQMHTVSSKILENGYPLVHTTSLKNNTIDFSNCFNVANQNSVVKGPAILFPRVGNFNHGKICILSSELEIVISDCIFAVKCKNLAEAECLKEAIETYWNEFKKNYSGTGAIYSSLAKIELFINSLYLNKYTQLKEIAA
ncbi:N-6 DNA methylase [Acinetobacter oleivorans]|uniref:N-6 DNA methylase n=1 Tax=Acinetobacter oleivorans TaxID=1148157 RepID=UPI000DD01B7D|nr:N-6 DNA methylase [Acinetobacter oleivorans]